MANKFSHLYMAILGLKNSSCKLFIWVFFWQKAEKYRTLLVLFYFSGQKNRNLEGTACNLFTFLLKKADERRIIQQCKQNSAHIVSEFLTRKAAENKLVLY